MKRIFVISLLSLYGILSIGIHLHIHYCCGHMAQVSILGSDNTCCDHPASCNTTISKKCCSNDVIDLSITDEHYSSCFKYLLLADNHAPASTAIVAHIENSKTNWSTPNHGPPLLSRLFLRYSSLIFYA